MTTKEPTEYLKPIDWFTRSWDETNDPSLNKILFEEMYNAGTPARRDINILVPETEDLKSRLFEFPVNTSYFSHDSTLIVFNYTPTAETYDASRKFVRTSLRQIESVKNPTNPFRMVDYYASIVPNLIEVGKMKFNDVYNNFKK